MILQRDIFIHEVYQALKVSKQIYFLSADFGAEALDHLRKDFPKNFIHCGISEQAMFNVATGLALEKKKVFVYAMAPFISLRAIEQIKCGPSMMNLPMTILSVGIGLGYADAGPTHYATEDFACLRSIIGTKIFTPSDNLTVKLLAKDIIKNYKGLNYVRLDRHPVQDRISGLSNKDFQDGFRIIGNFHKNKIVIISHGRILNQCLQVLKNNYDQCFVVDLFRSKPISRRLITRLKNNKKILIVDEQCEAGNLSSSVFEAFCKFNIFPKIKIICLPEEYIFENGGRDYLLKKYKLDFSNIERVLLSYIK
jgi:transketolase